MLSKFVNMFGNVFCWHVTYIFTCTHMHVPVVFDASAVDVCIYTSMNAPAPHWGKKKLNPGMPSNWNAVVMDSFSLRRVSLHAKTARYLQAKSENAIGKTMRMWDILLASGMDICFIFNSFLLTPWDCWCFVPACHQFPCFIFNLCL